MKLSIVIPAYNEEGRIGRTLANYIEAMTSRYGNDYEIIVVSNGSTDRTSEIVRQISINNPIVKGLYYQEKLGKGGAVIEGFKMAKGDFIGFADADESTVVKEYINLIEFLMNSNIDGAIGSRKIEGARILVKQPLRRRIASKIFNTLARIFFGLPFKDTQCGAKVFKKDAIADILGALISRGFEFDVEVLWRLKNKGYIVKEVPITWKHEKGSTFSLKYAPQMLFNIIKVRFLS